MRAVAGEGGGAFAAKARPSLRRRGGSESRDPCLPGHSLGSGPKRMPQKRTGRTHSGSEDVVGGAWTDAWTDTRTRADMGEQEMLHVFFPAKHSKLQAVVVVTRARV